MQNLIKFLAPLMLGLAASTVTYADTIKSHCVIYKNDKIVKRTHCNEQFSGSGHGGAGESESRFRIQGFGNIIAKTESGVWKSDELKHNPPQKNGYYQRWYIGAYDDNQFWQKHTLNNKKAIAQKRDSKTLKVIPINSDKDFDALQGTPTLIDAYHCYKQVQGNIEFCSRSLE